MNPRARTIFGIALALLFVALGLYGLQNQEHVPVYLLFVTFRGTQAWVPAGLFMLLMFAVCVVYGLASGTAWHFRHRRLARDHSRHQSRATTLEKDLADAQAEIKRLTNELAAQTPSRPVADALTTPRD